MTLLELPVGMDGGDILFMRANCVVRVDVAASSSFEIVKVFFLTRIQKTNPCHIVT